jgi:glyoxylase-like metal-dependent hydrolase (beta-lactamase superfamily II)
LVKEKGHGIFMDLGITLTLVDFLKVLEQKEIPRENANYVMVTSIHLDQAGGAGAIIKKFPTTKLVAHPKGTRNMIDSTHLIQ